MNAIARPRFPRKTIAIAAAALVAAGGLLVSFPSQASQEKDKAKAPVVLELAASDLATVTHGRLHSRLPSRAR